jgi:hypothetical protein
LLVGEEERGREGRKVGWRKGGTKEGDREAGRERETLTTSAHRINYAAFLN